MPVFLPGLWTEWMAWDPELYPDPAAYLGKVGWDQTTAVVNYEVCASKMALEVSDWVSRRDEGPDDYARGVRHGRTWLVSCICLLCRITAF